MVIIKKQSKKKRREGKRVFLPALLFFLVFPYVMSSFGGADRQTLVFEEKAGQVWVARKKLWGTGYCLLEEYLVGMVAATIPAEYETETLKAQTVILRSYCMKQMEKKDGKKVIDSKKLEEYYLSKKECERLWGEETKANLEKITKAVEATKGMLMICNGDIADPPFCRMSNGDTRDIREYAAHMEKYPYMKTVICGHDKEASDYLQYVEVSEKEFKKTVNRLLGQKSDSLERLVLYRDELGYVKEIMIGDERVDGEVFRNAFGLASSCFYLDHINGVIELKTKGIGHGFGFSQYEADQLAKAGESYSFLLEHFFENITLEKL